MSNHLITVASAISLPALPLLIWWVWHKRPFDSPKGFDHKSMDSWLETGEFFEGVDTSSEGSAEELANRFVDRLTQHEDDAAIRKHVKIGLRILLVILPLFWLGALFHLFRILK